MSVIPPVPVKSEMTYEAYLAARKEYVIFVCQNLRHDDAEAAMRALWNAAKPSAAEREAERVEFERMIDSSQAGAATDKITHTAELEAVRADALDIERRLALRKRGTIRDLTKQLKAATVRITTLMARIAQCDRIIASRSYTAGVLNDQRSR